ncbi:lipocalin family protein [Aequorivita todarodis]|uniref:lipocalin family protein n=1 Tax=Aequorivita todarodis TaxID=2036821 RepID=UPI002350408B|nr:lipocalin family protein [Aequorivita todarodis]MDC8001129.1 lipocalin family protein [Aequorivita todarodis]
MKTTRSSYNVLVVLMMFVSISSCSKKNDDNPPPTPTVAELLIHKWYFSKREVNGTVQMADACTEKTYFDFKGDGTFTFQESDYDDTLNCVTSPVLDGAYTLSSDETQLMISGAIGNQTLTINSISESQLVFGFANGEINTLKR